MKIIILILAFEISIIISSAEPINYSNFCGEVQRNISFKYAIRVKQVVDNPEHDVVYFFTEDTVFEVPALTNAIKPEEKSKHVLYEILFNEPKMKPLDQFWDTFKLADEHYNTAFCDWKSLNRSFWFIGDKYREIGIDVLAFKVTEDNKLTAFSDGKFGFLKNEKIKELGFENIIGVVFAYTWSPNEPFQPIQVYLKGDRGKMSSFQFDNYTDVVEKYEYGYTNYDYQLDSAVFLSPGRSLGGLPIQKHINHYFDIRTYKGAFNLFDFSYNKDNLFSGTNEELLGCAPSFCQSHQFDAIVRFLDGRQQLIYREYSWDFIKPFERINYHTYRKTNIISRKKNGFVKSFDFAIRNIIDGTFIHDGTIYIFRNGSFIDTKDNFDKLNMENKKFINFKDIAASFNGIPSQFYDAIFYHKQTAIAFFILHDMYWAYSMTDKSLHPRGQYPKQIQELGLPSNFKVKATYVEEDNQQQVNFYFFGRKLFLTFNATQFNEEILKFENGNEEYVCASIFLGCPENDYFACMPDPFEEKPDNTLLLIILIAVLIIAVFIVIVLAVVLYCCLIKRNRGSQQSEEPNPEASEFADNTSAVSRRSELVKPQRT